MAKKQTTCPECGGAKRGRGYAHKDGCKAIPASMKYRKKGKRRAAPSSRSPKGSDYQSLQGMDVRELIDLRNQIDAILKTKKPELRAEIKAMQQTLQVIGR